LRRKAAEKNCELDGETEVWRSALVHNDASKFDRSYDSWVAEASKLGEMYAAVARDAYKPVEKAVAKRTA